MRFRIKANTVHKTVEVVARQRFKVQLLYAWITRSGHSLLSLSIN